MLSYYQISQTINRPEPSEDFEDYGGSSNEIPQDPLEGINNNNIIDGYDEAKGFNEEATVTLGVVEITHPPPTTTTVEITTVPTSNIFSTYF